MVPILVSIPFLLLSFIIIILINFRLAASTVISSKKANRTVAHLKRIFFDTGTVAYMMGRTYDLQYRAIRKERRKKKVGYVTGTFLTIWILLLILACVYVQTNNG